MEWNLFHVALEPWLSWKNMGLVLGPIVVKNEYLKFWALRLDWVMLWAKEVYIVQSWLQIHILLLCLFLYLFTCGSLCENRCICKNLYNPFCFQNKSLSLQIMMNITFKMVLEGAIWLGPNEFHEQTLLHQRLHNGSTRTLITLL